MYSTFAAFSACHHQHFLSIISSTSKTVDLRCKWSDLKCYLYELFGSGRADVHGPLVRLICSCCIPCLPVRSCLLQILAAAPGILDYSVNASPILVGKPERIRHPFAVRILLHW